MSFRNKLAALLLLAVMVPPAVLADTTYFDQGKKLFDTRHFQQALPYFHKAAQDAPWDSSAAYYEALCYQYLKDWPHAITAYRSIVDRFPGSAAYGNSLNALKTLDPDYLKNKSAGGSATHAASVPASTSSSSSDQVNVQALLQKVQLTAPSQTMKIPVVRQTDKTWVDGSINGSNFKFDFSGGEDTTISPKDAQRMNLPAKSGRVMVSVKVGQISEGSFPLLIEETDHPKLGKDFFNQFTYSLEPSALVVTKKSGAAAASSWDVPFRKSGKDMMVDVLINGRRNSMVLDPDANECVVPARRAREFGLEINEAQMMNKFDPVLNPTGPLRGEPGYGEIKSNVTGEAKVVFGPVNSQARVKVDENAREAKLSPSVFGGWQYKIDPAANMIRFSH